VDKAEILHFMKADVVHRQIRCCIDWIWNFL